MKMTNKLAGCILLIMVLLLNAAPCLGQVVASNEAIYQAVKKVKPSGILQIADGTYKDIKLIISNSGKPDLPITIQAENPGKVFFTGDAKVEMRGEHLVLEGIWFKDGNRDIQKWKSHGPGLVAMYGSYNRVTACVFDCFDEANSAYITTSLTEDGKVPQYCRIDHCSFTDKITFDQVINLNNTAKAIKDGSAGGPAMYHRVDHCFFANPQKPGNAGGGIRIGYYRNDMGRCLVDSNLFMRQDSEAEIITSKSQENVFYGNTFLNCQGTMNFRHGDHQVAINNFYMGNDDKFGYGGMFVWGSKHVIACNYFELPETIKSRGNAALYLNPGPVASEHALAFDMLIVNNEFINVNGYAIHFNPLDERRKEYCAVNQLKFETPHQLVIEGNLFFRGKNYSYPFFKDDYFELGKNTWSGNMASGAATGIMLDIPASKSAYKPVEVNSIRPIEGIALDLNALVSQGVTGKPLTWDNVRPYWLKEMPGTYALTGKLSPDRAAKFKEVIKRNEITIPVN
jgi:chondroitin B lyase